MVDSQGGVKGKIIERAQPLTSRGIAFTPKLLLPSGVKKIVILKHLDDRGCVRNRNKRKKIDFTRR